LVEQACRIAADMRIALVVGCPEPDARGTYNTAYLIGADGAVAAAYRKTHLYGSREAAIFVSGDEPVVQARVKGVTVGLLICYDVEFPELVRMHAQRGTELLIVPTALARPWEIVADVLVPARAFENHLFIAYANWSGSDADLDYCGLTRVVDPHGGITTAPADGDHLVGTCVNLTDIEAARAAPPYLADRRPGLYRDLAVQS
jgi:predicted amidohydrolase